MSESTEDKDTKKDKKSTNPWVIAILVVAALIVVATVVFCVFYVTNIKLEDMRHNTELNNRHDEEKKGIVVKEGKNEYKNIDIDSDNQIKNNSGIELSKDLELAIKIENNGGKNETITVNGTTALGGLDVNNGYAKFQDLNGKTHIVSTKNIDVTYGGVKLSDNMINMMDNVSYDNGKVIFDNLKTSISYDSDKGSAVIKYTDNNGMEFGSTMLNNLTEKDGKIYSGDRLLNNEQQNLFCVLDRAMDKKYTSTKDIFNPKFIEDNESQQNIEPSTNNSSAKTNLSSVVNKQAKL